MRIAFLCLGVMGHPMAGHVARHGHDVVVYNRTRAVRDAWLAEYPGRGADTPAEAVRGCDIVLACTGADADLCAITLGPEGAFDAMAHGACFVDHTTVSAGLARELAGEAARRGLGWLDGPVSGGQSGAQKGQLTVMLGGEPEDYRRVAPILDCYARKHVLIGPAGAGQLTKMVNQICIAGLLQGLAEGLHFARRAGLDTEKVVDVISGGAAQSWQMDNRAATMLAGRYDFGFAVDWMRKDLGIALAEADRCGASLPVARLVDGFYQELQAQGFARSDTSCLLERLEGRAKTG